MFKVNSKKFAIKQKFKQNQFLLIIFILLFIFINLTSYANKMPLFHEEPRRVIVAQEMILTGDYIVPKVYQKPYYKKPPFHNWIIALFSLPQGKVTDYSARLVSVLAFLSLGILVYLLLAKMNKNVALTAFLIIMTNYLLMCEYGNKAEPDMLLTTLTFLSYFFYIRNPTQLSSIFISSLFMGAGILTKGVSPVFFYPAMLIYILWKSPRPAQRIKYLVIHLFLSLILPIGWVILYSLHGNLNLLLNIFNSEVKLRTQWSIFNFLKHLIYYPIKIWIVLLPWSLVLFISFRKNVQKNEILETSFIIFIFSLIIFSFLPESRDRYLMPAFPFFAIFAAHHIDENMTVSLKISKFIFKSFILTFLGGSIFFFYKGFYIQIALFIIASLIIFFFQKKEFRVITFSVIISLTFLIAYEHGLYFYRSQIKKDYKNKAEKLANLLTSNKPNTFSSLFRRYFTTTYLC